MPWERSDSGRPLHSCRFSERQSEFAPELRPWPARQRRFLWQLPIEAGRASLRSSCETRCPLAQYNENLSGSIIDSRRYENCLRRGCAAKSRAGGTEALGSAGCLTQFAFDNLTGQKGMFQQLRDLVSFADAVRLVAQVLHQHDDFATIAGVNYPGVAHQALAGQPRARLHDAARCGHEFDGNT